MGSHDHRSLQLFLKMYYYASPTLRSEMTVSLKKSQHICWKQPHHVTDERFFCQSCTLISLHFVKFDTTTCCKLLVWQHHFCDRVKKIQGPKSCKFLQLFEATCVRNLLVVKNLEQEKFKEYTWKKKIVLSVPYIWKIMLHYLDHMKPCCKLLQQTSRI